MLRCAVPLSDLNAAPESAVRFLAHDWKRARAQTDI